MPASDDDFNAALKALDAAVSEAAEFFSRSEPDLFDGHQTAVEVLSHLVFWHCEYAAIIRAIRKGAKPELCAGTFAELNAAAAREFAALPMDELTCMLLSRHEAFVKELKRVSDLSLDFPVKLGGRTKIIRDRVPQITVHIHNHVRRLKSAERHGEEWVKAYYQEG